MMTDSNHIVAIDLGSNSFQMVIAKEHASKLTIVERQKQRINLALGLDQHNKLSESAIERGVACLKEFSQSFSRLPHSKVRIVATHSLRKAVNRDDFIKAAFKVLPYPIEIIDGNREAQLIFKGIAHTQAITQRTLIIDIGGGSTEFIIGRHFDPSLTCSLELGSSHLRRVCFTQDIITQVQFEHGNEIVKQQLVTVADRYRKFGWKKVLGTSGSIKLVSQCLEQLFNSAIITPKSLNKLRKKLISWGNVEAIELNNFDQDKMHLLPSAVCILQNICEQFAIESIQFCPAALREGVLYGLSESRHDSDIRHQTLESMVRLYHTDVEYSRRVTSQLHNFVEQLPPGHTLNAKEWNCLSWAAQLHEVGLAINSKKRQFHSAYIIEHSDMLGFDEYEKNLVMTLVRYHRGKITKHPVLFSIERNRFMTLLSLFRLAIICTKGRLNSAPIGLQININNHCIIGNVLPSLRGSNGLIRDLFEEKERLNNAGITLDLRCDTVA